MTDTNNARDGLITAADVAAFIERKADDYAREFGTNDMGSLSFGNEDMRIYHWHLVELADEIRDFATPSAPQQAGDGLTDADALADLTVNEWAVAGKMPQMAWDFRELVADGIRRALAAPRQPGEVGAGVQADGVRWDMFPAWLIDHCEGETITEEGLQSALADMLKLYPAAKAASAQQDEREALSTMNDDDLYNAIAASITVNSAGCIVIRTEEFRKNVKGDE